MVNPDNNHGEPFPALVDTARNETTNPTSNSSPPATPSRHQRLGEVHGPGPSSRERQASRSSLGSSIRRLSRQFEESSLPEGFMAATGEFASSLASLDRSLDNNRSGDRARPHRGYSSPRSPSTPLYPIPSSAVPGSPATAATPANEAPAPIPISEANEVQGIGGTEEKHLGQASVHQQQTATGTRTGTGNGNGNGNQDRPGGSSDQTTIADPAREGEDAALTEPFDNGYHFPPKYTWQESTKKGLKAFWNYFTTPLGFVVTIYGLNVVAWGGMLFLILCGAAPAMCHPTCDDINSSKRIWIEIDSQILNALFCVTGFGLAPWRFRDFYYLLRYRLLGDQEGLRRLAGIHRGWFRLPGSQLLPMDVRPGHVPADVPAGSVPYPTEKVPEPPLTGIRALPTPIWKMDYVVQTNVWNTFFQALLAAFMWAYNRINRPPWATGLFVGLALIVACMGGIMMFVEGKKVKSIEGVPLSDQDQQRLEHDKELGIPHYNNIKDKKPKDKDKEKMEKAEKERDRAEETADSEKRGQ